MCLNALARYLLAVYQLSADGAAVRSVEIANALGVSRASVVKSLKKLAEGGFVQKEYYGSVHLTPQGLREAGRLHREYTLLSSYFTSCLACPKAAAEKDALCALCRFSPESKEQMIRLAQAQAGKSFFPKKQNTP
ncbi:MAG TPA: metal-dependent transcriptional regulator [Candidatus Anaerotruncus excrementipullorum]|uniref:Metal-dependent transcriptional regulator n=1 Tax=Candidatus Anaerotruncus excrementipullorum TaxID=2838465 RepID=A0A9D1WPY1_9FIRM|nr:metal-dependent transcriptional regulator [Candidatus Anaerotruncus excrementipullorum]